VNGLTLLLSLVRGSFSDELLVGKLERALATQDIIVPSVTVQRLEAIPKGASGKAPLIKSNLSAVSTNGHSEQLVK
jgi:hypothetical protein